MITLEIQAFILDRKTRLLAENTIAFYRQELSLLITYCNTIHDLTPPLLRQILVDLRARRSPGGVHAFYRAVSAFCNWYEREEEFDNPIHKVPAPNVIREVKPGISTATFKALVQGLNAKDNYTIRNRAIFYFLFDSGLRVTELCNLLIRDVDLNTGAVFVAHGKGGRSRTVFIGIQTRRELIRYLKRREYRQNDPLFLNRYNRAFDRAGIEAVIDSVCERAGITPPSPHDFRRAYALNMLRQGVDLFTLARLMGHSDITVLRRYLALTDIDNLRAPSVVDNLS